ncbi:MAG: TIGR04222 domain-containing membrane protein [Methylococcales bacterium]
MIVEYLKYIFLAMVVGRDVHFVRVNTRSHWLLPKVSSAIAAVVLGLVLVIFTNSAFARELPNSLNLLDQLALVGVYAIIGLVLLTLVVSRRISKTSPPLAVGRPLDPPLTAEELAYLAGWQNRLVETVLVGLVQRGGVSLDKNGRTLQIRRPGINYSPLEQRIVESIASGNTIERIDLADSDTADIRARLRNMGLVKGSSQTRTPWFVSGLNFVTAGLLFFGQPVGWLLPIVCVGITWLHVLFDSLHRSAYGDNVLAHAQGQAVDK